MNELSDNQLVQKTLYENKEFFALLVQRYEEKLSRYIMRISRVSKEDVEDILQDVFLKVYKNLHDFDGKLSFSSWIYRITRNTVIDRHRALAHKDGGLKVIDTDDDILSHFMNDEEIVSGIEKDFFKKYYARALAKIPNIYREVIILYYFEEKTYRDISDILKKPENTVATLLSRAKKKLRREINLLTKNTYE